MADFTLEQAVDALEGGWADYIARYERLTPSEQASFLQAQGFTRFRDLVAHIIAWWEEGHRIISGISDDPNFNWQGHDIDRFNAEAVERFGTLPEVDVYDYFHRMRQVMFDLIADLPENALDNPDVRDWIRVDVLEHLDEHALPG